MIVDGAAGTRVGGPEPGQANVISANKGGGIRVVNAAGTRIESNRIGTTADGQTLVAGQPFGVSVIGSVGGTQLLGNTIAGHANGVLIDASVGDVITDNRILVSSQAGVTLVGPKQTLLTANVIGGGGDGVIVGPGAVETRLTGNFIGLDADDTILGNTGAGVRVTQAADIAVGDFDAQPNRIAGNFGGGVVVISSANASIVNNFIGTKSDGATLVPGQPTGVSVSGLSPNARAVGNRIGGHGVGVAIASAGGEVRDNAVFGGQVGVRLTGAANALVRGNTITNHSGDAVAVTDGSTSARVVGNFVGIDGQGTPSGNLGAGVRITQSASVFVGGAATGDRNVISANSGGGVVISSGATGTRVEGNFFGTGPGGKTAVNGQPVGVRAEGGAVGSQIVNNRIVGHAQGIVVESAANSSLTNNRILGAAKAGVALTGAVGAVVRGNVVGSGGGDGVIVQGASKGVSLVGNFIGIDDNGTSLPNSGVGVRITGTTGTVVGGPIAADRNVIASNLGGGFVLDQSNFARVVGNFIGTGPDGMGLPGNQPFGVLVVGGAAAAEISGNTVAGHSEGVVIGSAFNATVQGNVVRNNPTAGVRVSGASSTDADRQHDRRQRQRRRREHECDRHPVDGQRHRIE